MKGVVSLLLLFALVLPAAATTAYRWVDANGIVHYSDRPHPGAVKLNLETPPLPIPAVSAVTAAGTTAVQATVTPPSYALRILAPADGATLRPSNHVVRVQVGVEPPLSAGARLRYRLDANPVGQPTAETSRLLHEVYRGTHRLTVIVLAPDGRTVAEANAVFYVHQHSILLDNKNKPGPGG